MNSNNTITHLVVCTALFWVCTTNAIAQNQEQIRLLNQDNAQPIQGATFLYGDQTGTSNENGVIVFSFSKGHIMKLSHVNHGEWQLNDEDIQQAIQQRAYYRKSITRTLYPVTVIAVRSNPSLLKEMTLEYEDRMAHDGGALLNQLPAFGGIRKSGNYGFDPVFRGFKYDQLNVVLNGAQSVMAACPNRMDPPTSQMAPNMIDRIELLKGPYALRYGTGFGATINFVPSKPRFTEKVDGYGRVSMGYEGNGNVVRTEGQVGISGKVYNLNLFGAWSQGGDYTTGNEQSVAAGFQRGSFGAGLNLKLTPNQQVQASFTYNRARDTDFPALGMDLRNDDTWMVNVRHNVDLNKTSLTSWSTVAFASFVDHLMDNLLKPLDPRMLNATTNATTASYGGRTEGFWKFSKGSLYAGADLRIEGAKGVRKREFLMGPNAGKTFEENAWQEGLITKTSLFGEYHLYWPKYQLVFSARMEANTANSNDTAERFAQVYSKTEEVQFNPSVSAGVSRNLGRGIKMGLWLGRVQRSGSLVERFINYFPVGQDPYEMLGNPQLRPEVNNQVDLTFEWTTKNTAVNVDAFAGYLQDFISSTINSDLTPRLPNSPGVRQFINLNAAFKTGLEVNWVQNWIAGIQHQLGVAYTYAQDVERDAPLPEIAPLDFRYTLRGNYFDGKLQPEVSFRHVLQQDRISSEFGETTTPSFSLLGIRLSYQPSRRTRFSAGVNNLLNENYYEHLNRSVRSTKAPLFAPGRSVFASFTLNL